MVSTLHKKVIDASLVHLVTDATVVQEMRRLSVFQVLTLLVARSIVINVQLVMSAQILTKSLKSVHLVTTL